MSENAEKREFVLIALAALCIFLYTSCKMQEAIDKNDNILVNSGNNNSLEMQHIRKTQMQGIAMKKVKSNGDSKECERRIHDCSSGDFFQANLECPDCFGQEMSDNDARAILTLAVGRLMDKYKKHNSVKVQKPKHGMPNKIAVEKQKGDWKSNLNPHPYDLISYLMHEKNDGDKVLYANVASTLMHSKGREPRPNKLWIDKPDKIAQFKDLSGFDVFLKTWSLEKFETNNLKHDKDLSVLLFVLKYAEERVGRKIIVLSKSWVNWFAGEKKKNGKITWSTTITLSGHPSERFYFVKKEGTPWVLIGDHYDNSNDTVPSSLELCSELLGCK